MDTIEALIKEHQALLTSHGYLLDAIAAQSDGDRDRFTECLSKSIEKMAVIFAIKGEVCNATVTG